MPPFLDTKSLFICLLAGHELAQVRKWLYKSLALGVMKYVLLAHVVVLCELLCFMFGLRVLFWYVAVLSWCQYRIPVMLCLCVDICVSCFVYVYNVGK